MPHPTSPHPALLFPSVALVLVFAIAPLGCGGDGGGSTDPGWEERPTTLLPPWAEGCENPHVPVVMVHGFLASGDTYANHVMRFVANGYCQDRLFVYDWNSIGGGNSPALLDAFIDEVLSVTGATQVDLLGHSAGGGIGYTYLSDDARAAKVRRYVHIASGDEDAPPGSAGGVPTLNLFSANDRVVTNDGIEGATNVDLETADHYEVATRDDSFEAIWEFLNDAPPAVSAIVAQEEPIVIAGRAATLGENRPAEGATVDIYEVDADSGQRRRARPRATFIANAQGYWGPFQGAPDTHYEFHITPVSGRSVHYFREPFLRTNTKVYLRTLPTTGLARVLVSALKFDEDQPTTVIFLANRALQPGDQLLLDDVDLSGDAYTNRDNTTIALFFFDDNGNDETDLTPVALFQTFPFLAGADFAPGADPRVSTVVQLGERRLAMPRRPAEPDGVSIVVFD
ncbi:MAG: alpha/beta fold hydrolase [Polyangiales bacterium]|nr:alpha/beta fold hydrolase [Myxococcales bacterium]MCB9658173.1 alpha/beta fold hydrolase [Sandaracinaceae bacterium]